jgi:hypothetical protein
MAGRPGPHVVDLSDDHTASIAAGRPLFPTRLRAAHAIPATHVALLMAMEFGRRLR